ncbi:MAG TPA: hypothetical protein VLG36_01545 [Candidatus Chromulinivoraceae bacterium]|nr:hypothetical protein [Candidatus Chromulinivoraceae bacterium]
MAARKSNHQPKLSDPMLVDSDLRWALIRGARAELAKQGLTTRQYAGAQLMLAQFQSDRFIVWSKRLNRAWAKTVEQCKSDSPLPKVAGSLDHQDRSTGATGAYLARAALSTVRARLRNDLSVEALKLAIAGHTLDEKGNLHPDTLKALGLGDKGRNIKEARARAAYAINIATI